MEHKPVLCFFINVDWYFDLHWLARAKYALNNGFTVHIIATFTDPKLRKKFDTLGFFTHHISITRKSTDPIRLINNYFSAKKLIAFINPDILHCITIKPNILGGFIAKKLNIPVIFSVTGSGLAFSSDSNKIKALRLFVEFLYKTSYAKTKSVTLFEHHADQDLFIKTGICSSETSIVIPGAGVDLNKFKFSILPNPNIKPYRILFASRMLWDKGLTYAIDACNKLKAKGYDISLDVAGILDTDAQTAIPLELIETWHRNGDINWLGKVDEIDSLLNSANLVVLPTYYGEGIPRILIEASACGRPCITTDSGGCADIVINGQSGFIIPQHDAEILAEKIEVMINDQILSSKFGKFARTHVESFFDENQISKKTMEIYLTIKSLFPCDLSYAKVNN